MLSWRRHASYRDISQAVDLPECVYVKGFLLFAMGQLWAGEPCLSWGIHDGRVQACWRQSQGKREVVSSCEA